MPVITISRQLGCGGSMLAEKLSSALNYRLVDKVILTRAAQLAGVPEDRFEKLAREGREGLIERFLRNVARGLPDLDQYYRAFADLESEGPDAAEYAYYGHTHGPHHRLQRDDVLRYFEAAIRDLSQRGDVILLGRGGQMILRDMPHTLHVRLIGDLDYRVAQIARRQGLKPEDARRLIRDDDAKRVGYLQKNYGQNINDALLYDLVVRLDCVGLDDTVGLIRHWAIEEGKRQHQPFEQQIS